VDPLNGKFAKAPTEPIKKHVEDSEEDEAETNK
jgi:hypothetical protein